MNLKKGDSVELSVKELAFGGAGVAKMKGTDGTEFVVFVEGTVPGDRVQARFTRIKKQYAEARLEEILESSPLRIKPRCKHFGVCGGCRLQYLAYEEQLKIKEKMVVDSLRQIGGFRDIEIAPILGCESPWFYRNKMEYSFGPGPILGLHPAKRYQDVFDLEECFLQSPLSVKIAKAVAEWASKENISVCDPHTNRGVLKSLVVREGKNTEEIMVNLVTNGRDFPKEEAFKDFVLQNFPAVTSLYRTAIVIQKGFKTVIQEFHLGGKPTLTEILSVRFGEHALRLQFEIFPQAFFQPNTKQAERLYGKVLEFAGAKPEDQVLDLYCGTGTIGMFFAKCGAHVTGVEVNASAIENARVNAEKNGLKNIDFICGDMSKFFEKSAVGKPHILITDPPRAGIDAKPLQKILDLKIPKWVYVSCNPTTLARDLKIICADGYTLERVQPVDMFPQTYHVEIVCCLQKY